MSTGWAIEERTGAAGDLHASWPAVRAHPETRAVAVCRPTGPALVLGSTQREEVVEAGRATAAGVAVVRRRSGGGAVMVTPDDPVWVDVWVPRGDPLWRDDVARAFDWLGDAWAAGLGRLGAVGEVSAHRGAYAACTRWSTLVCFGGVGTGEVITADRRKVVGLSQRRGRQGAWFHSACYLRWDPTALLEMLALPEEERVAARMGLGAAVVGVTDLLVPPLDQIIDGPAIVAALVDSLP